MKKYNEKISESTQDLKSSSNNNDFLNTYYIDEANTLDIQFRSSILNTYENDVRNLIELSKK